MKSFADIHDDRFGENYYECGVASGLSLYENYHYMPRRSIREALAFLDYMGAPDNCSVLDWGCAKGFFVEALLTLGVDAYGVDVSEYAVSAASPGVSGRLVLPDGVDSLAPCQFGFCKDTLEHCSNSDVLRATLSAMSGKAADWLVVVPLADGGKYRIESYESDLTHAMRMNEAEWLDEISKFMRVVCCQPSLPGIKDSWRITDPFGNMVVKTKQLDLR